MEESRVEALGRAQLLVVGATPAAVVALESFAGDGWSRCRSRCSLYFVGNVVVRPGMAGCCLGRVDGSREWWVGCSWAGLWRLRFCAVSTQCGAVELLEPMVGIGRSMALVGAFQLGALAACTGCWFRRGSRAAALVAGLGVLGLRQSFFGLAEGSVVAVTALFVPLGIVCLRRSACLDRTEHSRRKWAAFAGLSMVALSLENPYLAPLLPGWALCMLLGMGWRWRAHGQRPPSIQTLATGFLGGVVGMGAVAWLFGRTASPDYPTRLGDHFVSFFGLPSRWSSRPGLEWGRVNGSILWPYSGPWTIPRSHGTWRWLFGCGVVWPGHWRAGVCPSNFVAVSYFGIEWIGAQYGNGHGRYPCRLGS